MNTTYRFRQISLVLLFGVTAGGCPSEEKAVPTETAACQRLDECNYLGAGLSVAECSNEALDCLDTQPTAARADWAEQTFDCLQFKSCGNFARCMTEVAACRVGNLEPAKPDADGGVETDQPKLVEGLIQFPRMYTAYDGTHDYQVTPSVPLADPATAAADAVDESSLVWSVDDKYVRVSPFSELHGALRLTTKRVGKTTVKVSGVTLSGVKVRGEAELNIAAARQEEWDAGDARFHNGMTVQWMRPQMAAAGEGTCGLPITIDLPKTSACSNCHDSTSSGFSMQYTPTQLAGYSDEQLIKIFTTGEKPAGGKFISPFLRNAPMPDCLYKAFHTWSMTDDEQKGVVWTLRSIAPKAIDEIDAQRLTPAK